MTFVSRHSIVTSSPKTGHLPYLMFSRSTAVSSSAFLSSSIALILSSRHAPVQCLSHFMNLFPPFRCPSILSFLILARFVTPQSYNNISFASLRGLTSFHMPSLLLMSRLRLTPSCASSPDNSLSDKSSMMLSNHLRFGLRLLLFHHHHPLSCTHIFLLFSIICLPLRPTFQQFLGCFSHLLGVSNSLNTSYYYVV